jgi:2-keto-4-pentenoate hydratase/2-oxohepta-3-ene-1,7-dioic acid hydratase in catechol pathway
MRIVTYLAERGPRAGLLRGGELIDVWDAIGGDGSSVRDLLASGRLDEAESAEEDPIDVDGVELLVPVSDPPKIICLGLNYRSHAEEAGVEPPASPTFFAKFHNALVPDGATVALPSASRKVDYEAEVAFVVGRYCHEVDEQEAAEAIAGYTLFNDLSARDLQFATPQWIPGKVFDGSGPCGPALVTPGEAGAHDAIEFALDLNGERRQDASTAELIFSAPALLAHLSTLMTMEPGDIVATGTPGGTGSTRRPRAWLEDGDELVITSPQLGELRTTIG